MPTRLTLRNAAAQRSAASLAYIGRELRIARREHGLSQAAVAQAAGLSRSKVSRVELGKDRRLSVADATALLAAVGLDLSLKTYVGGNPARDAASTALLERFRLRIHAALGWQTEVPFPIQGDRRAWDALVTGPDWSLGVEAETHPDDRQALERRIAIKARDGGTTRVVLLLARTVANRQFVQLHEEALRRRFPVGQREALGALRAGRLPAGDALILL
jgi:transcriptional regulator with XRE-family HTH domain